MLAKWMNPVASTTARPTNSAPVLQSFFRDAGLLFEGALASPSAWTTEDVAATAATDVLETQESLVLAMDLPGVDPAEVKVRVEGDVLTVEASRPGPKPERASWLRRERPHGAIARTFVLPETVDGTRCEAAYHQGVLTLTMPRREEAKPRSIQVQVR